MFSGFCPQQNQSFGIRLEYYPTLFSPHVAAYPPGRVIAPWAHSNTLMRCASSRQSPNNQGGPSCESRVRRMFARMRAELDEMASRHAAEADRLREELNQVRAAFDELRSISFVRQRAEQELASLHR